MSVGDTYKSRSSTQLTPSGQMLPNGGYLCEKSDRTSKYHSIPNNFALIFTTSYS